MKLAIFWGRMCSEAWPRLDRANLRTTWEHSLNKLEPPLNLRGPTGVVSPTRCRQCHFSIQDRDCARSSADSICRHGAIQGSGAFQNAATLGARSSDSFCAASNACRSACSVKISGVMISLPNLVKPPPCELNPHLLPDEADWTTGHALSGADDLLRRGSGLERLLWWSGNSIDSAATRAKACDAIVLKSAAAFLEAGA